jgi:hypothetical protein
MARAAFFILGRSIFLGAAHLRRQRLRIQFDRPAAGPNRSQGFGVAELLGLFEGLLCGFFLLHGDSSRVWNGVTGPDERVSGNGAPKRNKNPESAGANRRGRFGSMLNNSMRVSCAVTSRVHAIGGR